jgi:hypothetical protein
MPFPEPRPGLVLSYAYLWHREHRAGQEEGRKDRPCVIVVAVRDTQEGPLIARVVPITHNIPDNVDAAIELPLAVKRHLGLDDARSWIILDEINEFAWPGFDLRPVQRTYDRYDFGSLPPRLFEVLVTKMGEVWRNGWGKKTPRD